MQFEVDLSGLIGLAQRAVAEVKYMSPREINELRYRIPEVKKQLERRIRRMENFCANSEEVDRLKKIVEVAQGWQLKLEQLIFGHQS